MLASRERWGTVLVGVLIGLLPWSVNAAASQGLFEPFLALPTADRGFVALTSESFRPPGTNFGELVLLIDWNGSNFFCETGYLRDFSPKGQLRSAPLMAAGTYSGTNWTFREGLLVFRGQSGPILAESERTLMGRLATRMVLDKIIGRGMDVESIRSLRMNEDGTFTGKFFAPEGAVALDGKIHTGNSALEFTLEYSLSGMRPPVSYAHHVILQSFQDGYIPSEVTTEFRMGEEASTTHVRVVYCQDQPRYGTLAPSSILAVTETGLLERDELYLIKGTNRIHIPETAVAADPPRKAPSRAVVVATILFLTLLFAFFLGKHHFIDSPTSKQNKN